MKSVSKSLQGNFETIDMRFFSGGHRPGRFRKCTRSKCRAVFSGIGGGIFMVCCAFLMVYVCVVVCCVFVVYVFLWYVVFFCVVGMFAFVCRKPVLEWCVFRRSEG